MAVQIEVDELKGCQEYFEWILDEVTEPISSLEGLNRVEHKEQTRALPGSPVYERLQQFGAHRGAMVDVCRVMFEKDFIWNESIKEDEIRAKDAMEIRRRYAASVGAKTGKSEREIDRIWKSIHGNCSVLELILSICYRLDAMVNEDEPGAMVGIFFRILIGNLGLPGNFNGENSADKTVIAAVKVVKDAHYTYIIDRFLDREYNPDGSGGGLFPLEKWSAEGGSKDQRTVSIWYQMGTWLNEHLDEEAHFVE